MYSMYEYYTFCVKIGLFLLIYVKIASDEACQII